MSKQPEALRLADEADDWRTDHTERGDHIRESAAELRRQHALIEKLREALNGVVNLWDHHASAHGDGVISPLHAAARAAIAKAEEQQ